MRSLPIGWNNLIAKLGFKRFAEKRVRRARVQSKLCFEALEDRRVLAALADIVFLMDESGSNNNGPVYTWLKNTVFAPTSGQTNPIAAELSSIGISDVRYGLVGFGSSERFNDGLAHSYIVHAAGPDPLFGTASQMDAALEEVRFGGDGEDGWDAFEHVIAEYNFREGAVPVVVLLQNVEGRNRENTSLTRDGIFAALASKNIVLNTMTYGDTLGSTGIAELFDLSPYGGNSNVRILGVEADRADGVVDGQHNYIGLNTATGATVTTVGATSSQAMQVSFNGSNTGVTGMVASGKSVVLSTSGGGELGPSALGYRADGTTMSAIDMTSGTIRSNLSSAEGDATTGPWETYPIGGMSFALNDTRSSFKTSS
jgi:hypothetical protein